ncbi:MAG: hypothetical protein WC998_00060 [Candidatus Paceibacterota bacterium]
MKKNYLIISLLLIAALVIGACQYYGALNMELVSAGTKPANGHLWSEMESGSDSIQVSSRMITNLTAPINPTDVTNKQYVDAAGGLVTYSSCYIINKKVAGLTCTTGYIALASFSTSTCCWSFHSSLGGGSNNSYVVTGVGGSNVEFSFGATISSEFQPMACLSDYSANAGTATIKVGNIDQNSNAGYDTNASGVCQGVVHSLVLCCK